MAESEAETPSTPGEFESKYFEYNGVRLPPFCRGKMEEIANFPVRDSDVWIVTYPKSGRRAGRAASGSLPGRGRLLRAGRERRARGGPRGEVGPGPREGRPPPANGAAGGEEGRPAGADMARVIPDVTDRCTCRLFRSPAVPPPRGGCEHVPRVHCGCAGRPERALPDPPVCVPPPSASCFTYRISSFLILPVSVQRC